MKVLGRGLQVGVAEELLDGADVDAIADEMRGEGVAEFVGRYAVPFQIRPVDDSC